MICCLVPFRYSGYCAWRGVLNFSDSENSETILMLKKAYPDLGKCLYFNMGLRTHTVFYELLNKNINWIWYINQSEPQTKVSMFYTLILHEHMTSTISIMICVDFNFNVSMFRSVSRMGSKDIHTII